MREEMTKRLQLYRKILSRQQLLYSISEKLYNEEPHSQEPQRITTLYVMAPVMVLYILWVLQEAVRTGKKRLYFLARDGYSMFHVAKTICEQAQIPVECRYLHCSRYAWRGAEYALLGEKGLDYICLGGIDVTMRKVMQRAGLTEDEGKRVAKLLEIGEYDRSMAYQEVKALIPRLTDCSYFMELMLGRSREKYPSVCAYLQQEGMLEDVSWAIVDSGWTGSMQKSLQHLLDSMGYQTRVEGFYFGMYEYPVGVERKTYHSWYFNPEEAIRRKVYFSNSLFECIFSSPEGMTVGYCKKDSLMVPVLETQESPNKKQILQSTAYLTRYASELVSVCERLQTPNGAITQTRTVSRRNKESMILHRIGNNEGRRLAFNLLQQFMGRPTAEEAQVYGDYVFCDDVIGEADNRVAAALSYQEIRENRLLYKGRNMLLRTGKPVRESAWLEGSIMQLEQAGERELQHCVMYKYMLYLRKRFT